MKKLAFILALAMTACAVSSCGEKKNSNTDISAETSDTAETTQQTTEATVDYSDDIIGIWMADSQSGTGENSFASGMAFYKDMTGDFIMDFSNIMYFNADGSFVAGETVFPAECTASVPDQDILMVNSGDNDVIVLKRTDSFGDNDEINGVYQLAGGALYDSITQTLKDSYGDANNNFCFIIKGEKMYLDMSGAFQYKLDGDSLAMAGAKAYFKDGVDSVKIDVSDDSLSLINGSDVQTFHRFNMMS